ncbi:MAG: ribose-5-phosphate isomerase RpiA [Parachlamydiales bacterium]|nr:ribose-5-phosphate isomerase RpiA [Verrucomicrobiota bacterium]MBX3720115.1 ribose-5-phosphate isomerase RpiA [Candidatus Acheromyda pituitae]
MSRDAVKKAVGYKAAELVEDGMLIGLGTGSTAYFFIEKLVQRCQEGLKIRAIASSLQSHNLAKKGKIPLLDIDAITSLDMTVDGADEIDPQKRMIKGGGGALVREKIVASMSKEMIVIVDEGKCVDKLGSAKLPVEVISFASHATLRRIANLGYHGEFRKNADNSLFVTDNGNQIIDIHFNEPRNNPEEDHEALMHIPGVVDTGFFFHLAGRVVIGFFDGQIVIKS